MYKVYNIYIDHIKIGTTLLENADAPMGVVFGLIKFIDSLNGYEFLKDICNKKQIDLIADDEENKLIITKSIGGLRILTNSGLEIKGLGNQIYGMANEGYTISIEGVDYPFFGEEFPHHVSNYENRFDKNK